jgi:hypothetical protein
MSISNIKTILDRISVATDESPIVVFKSLGQKGIELDAVFGSTFATSESIKNNERIFVGSYHQRHDTGRIERELKRAKDIF